MDNSKNTGRNIDAQMEDPLKQSEEKYRILIENIREGVFIIQDAKFQYANDAFARISGYNVEEIPGKDFREFVAPDDLKLVEDRYYRRQAGEDVPREYEFQMLRKNGDIIIVNMNVGIITYRGRVASMGILRDVTGRKKAEDKLRLFSEAVENAPDGVQIVDLSGNIIYSNKAVEEMYGYSSKELIGRHVNEMNVDPKFAGRVILPGIKETGRWTGELMVKHKNGGAFAVGLTASMVKNGTGEPIAMVGIIRDITTRREAENKLKAAHAFLQSIIDGVAEPILVIGTDYRVILMNKAAREFSLGLCENTGTLFCYQISHRRSSPCSEAGHPCPLEEVKKSCQPVMVVHEHGNSDGESRYIEILASPLCGADGAFQGIIESSRDITERKRAEDALRESEAKFRSVIEQSGDGIVLTDEQGTIIEWNSAEEQIIGIERSEAIGKPLWDIQFRMAPEEKKNPALYKKLKEDILELVSTGQSRWLNRLWENDIQLSSVRRSIQVLIFLIKTKKGFMAGSISRDVTERKRAEDAINKYAKELEESNRMKELFSDIMHHDLLNPLNIAKGYAEILKEDETCAEKAIYLKKIEGSMVRSLELIENATMFSKLESLENIEFENLDMKEIVEDVIENLRPLIDISNMEIENKLTQKIPVRANKLIGEVFANLISNAVKYAYTGKRIVVDGKENSKFWRINVMDFGEGIKDAEKAFIFDRFRRVEKKGVKGSGLGLAIARKIVELHSGRIAVEDNPEGGAVFVVEIPKLK